MSSPFGLDNSSSSKETSSEKKAKNSKKIYVALGSILFFLVAAMAASYFLFPHKTRTKRNPLLAHKKIQKEKVLKASSAVSKKTVEAKVREKIVPSRFTPKKAVKLVSEEAQKLKEKNPFENEIINKNLKKLVEHKIEILKPKLKAEIEKELKEKYAEKIKEAKKRANEAIRSLKACKTLAARLKKARKPVLVKRKKKVLKRIVQRHTQPKIKLEKKTVPSYVGVIRFGEDVYYQMKDGSIMQKSKFDKLVKEIEDYNAKIQKASGQNSSS